MLAATIAAQPACGIRFGNRLPNRIPATDFVKSVQHQQVNDHRNLLRDHQSAAKRMILDLKICLERPQESTIERVFHARTGSTGVTHEGDYGLRSKVLSHARYLSEKVSMGVRYLDIITKVINVDNAFPLTMLKGSISLKKMCSRLRPVVRLMVLLVSLGVPHRMLSRQGLSHGVGSTIAIGNSFSFILGQ